MKFFCSLLIFLFSFSLWAQDDFVAKEYFDNGEFEKARIEYTKLHKQKPGNINYTLQLIKTLQQLEKYNDAETLILDQISRINYPAFYVELGYNFQLKNHIEEAQKNYTIALEAIDLNPSHAYTIARFFEQHSLLEQAITAYEKAKSLNPNLNFDLQLARIYGEQGDVEKMFNSYIDFVEINDTQLNNIKRAVSEFISEDATNENNLIFKRVLLKKIQEKPVLLYNQLLSWLFVQENDFKKAFAQEKAIFSRQPESLDRLFELAHICYDANNFTIAKEIYTFIANTSQDLDTLLNAHYNLLAIEVETALPSAYESIKLQYENLFNTHGKTAATLNIQIAYAHFLAFYLHQPEEASRFLKESLQLPLTPFKEANVKMELGDILVLQEHFNQALIYYTQIQRNLKNSTLSQLARFKVAKTSYYKGDFKWAESQLNVLKSSTSQLIANDALDLKLLISDNKYDDSLQVALKLYAKADLLAFQNKTDQAISILNKIIEEHKGETIEDQAYYKQAQLFEQKKEYDKAIANYQYILAHYPEDILADDTYYALGELYAKKLHQPETAKTFYEKIIFNHADSIYFVEAQKQYRKLRGDAIN